MCANASNKRHAGFHAGESGKARGLNRRPGLHLHPCFEYASSKGSGEPTHIRVGTSIIQLVNSSGKCRKVSA